MKTRLYVDVNTDYLTKETTISYSHTPEQLVEEMRTTDDTLCVAKRCCHECIYTPDSFKVSKQMVGEMEQEALPYQLIMECLCTGAARFLKHAFWGRGGDLPPNLPDYVCCYGFYYQHYHENQFLQALTEAKLITFYDTSLLPGMRKSGLSLIEPQWWDTNPYSPWR